MKLVKRLTTMILGAALLCTLVLVPGIKSNADTVVTWYLTNAGGQWFASNNTINYWTGDTGMIAREMKDGDNIVVNADNVTSDLVKLEVDKKIGDLVSMNGATASVTAPYAEKVYVAGKNSTLIATVGTANYVDVYPEQTIQVIGNVNNFTAHYTRGVAEYPHFGVTGTVAHANVNYTGNWASVYDDIYGIPAGVFNSNAEGGVTLTMEQFSYTPTAAPATQAPAGSKTDSQKQLDKVPQTGAFASTETIVFLMMAAVFAVAALSVRVVVKKRA